MFYYHNRVHKQPQSYERHSLILFFLLNVFCQDQLLDILSLSTVSYTHLIISIINFSVYLFFVYIKSIYKIYLLYYIHFRFIYQFFCIKTSLLKIISSRLFFNYFLKDLLLLQLPIIKTSFKYFTVISFTYSQNLSKELFNFKNINHYYISKINQYINESIFCK